MVLEIYILLPLIVVLCGITFYAGWFLNAKATKSKLMSAEDQAKKIWTMRKKPFTLKRKLG
jgi:flagellar basal body-associated protein FliL